ncbi:MAG: hypothetical protein WB760_28420 [Xanthobacteraceae bacterium]
MASVQEYKKFATECLRWATEAELEEDKENLLRMARDFALAAIQLEAGRLPGEVGDNLRRSASDCNEETREPARP